MNKRVVCFLVAVVMLLCSVMILTGCETEDNVRTDNKNATTVTLYMSKGEGTTDEAAQLVENAINVITESKLNTHVELYLYEKDKLHDAVVNRAKEISNMLETGEVVIEDDYGDEEEEQATDTVIVDDETGRKKTVYPEVGKAQMDIVLINGVEDFRDLCDLNIYYDGDYETNLLTPIEPSVLISQYVNAYLLTTARTNEMIQNGENGVLAIPNNRDFGHYTYLVLNKQLCDKYGYAPETLASHSEEELAAGYITSNEQMVRYLRAVHNDYPDMDLVRGVPSKEAMWFTFGEDIPVGRSQFVKYGNHLSTMLEAPPSNGFSVASIKGYYRIFAYLNSAGQPINESEPLDLTGDFAVGYVQGNALSIADVDTDKYYIAITDAPSKTNENMFASMYGVTKYSVNAERAAEVLELFSTNKAFRNLMYYGIKDVHYMVDEKGEYVKLNNDWNMDVYDTGNLYLLERSKDLGDYYYKLSADQWKVGKDMNRDSIEGMLLGFTWSSNAELEGHLNNLREKNKSWDKQLKAASYNDIDNLLDKFKVDLDNDADYMYITDSEEGSNSIYNQYRTWYAIMNPGQGG